MKTTATQLNNLVKTICDLTGLSNNKEQAISKGQDRYLYLEYASVYGGYRLVNVNVNSGGHSGAFGGSGTEARLKSSEMYTKLSALIAGIEYQQVINFKIK